MKTPGGSSTFVLRPTVLVRRTAFGPMRRLRLSAGERSGRISVTVSGEVGPLGSAHGFLRPGETLEVDVPEPASPTLLRGTVTYGAEATVPVELTLSPARRWTVHLVQLSHHDLGYTSLPGLVREEHARWLEQAIRFCRETDDLPEEARFHAVIEQAWSLEAFFERCSPGLRREMVRRLREGRLEVGALYGNMVTEAMGHAEMLRCLEPASALARRHGFPLSSAEHNDIPGFSWGLASALAAARIPLLVLGLPSYHLWAGDGADPLWDAQRLFVPGRPSVVRYAAPDGQEVLVWCGNRGCGGDLLTGLDALPDRLDEIEASGFPHEVLRWPVQGAARDNAPYVPAFCGFVREWNERFASPRLVVSTNARFYRDFESRLAYPLPTVRGELPGQDYPSGMLSVARTTVLGRRSQQDLPDISGLAALARILARNPAPADRVRDAWSDLLAYDEHAFGLNFPAGPASDAAQAEKGLRSFRCAALVHDAASRAMASLLDDLPPVPDGCWLAVFNPSPRRATKVVRTPLRELDNFLGDLHAVPPEQGATGPGHLVGVPLGNRWHDFPPDAFLQGTFRIVDGAGDDVPFSLTSVEETRPDPYAAQRTGLGRSGGRIDFQPTAAGLLLDLTFVARDLPAFGIALFRLLPSTTAAPVARFLPCVEGSIANAQYRIDLKEGRVRILARSTGRDLLELDGPDDPFRFLVSSSEGLSARGTVTGFQMLESPVVRALRILGTAPGHPRTSATLFLHEGFDRIDIRIEALKDDTPLLDVQMALPLAVKAPRLLHDGVLSAVEPGVDWIVPCRAGAVAVNEWVAVNDADGAVLMLPPAAMLGYDEPTPANVSFAHRSVYRRDVQHPFKGPARSGRIYWHLFDNDFGTNFAVTQCGCFGFSASLRAFEAPLSESEADLAAREMRDDAVTQFRQGRADAQADVPFGLDLVRLSDPVRLLSFEALPGTDDCRLAIWNRTDRPQEPLLAFGGMRIDHVRRTTATGAFLESLRSGRDSVRLALPPHGLLFLTARLARSEPRAGNPLKGEKGR